MARILIVEDETVIAMMLELWLADCGHAPVGPAINIALALEIIANGELDGAIVDVSLDGQRSYPIADALAAARIPFVWGTGYSRKELDEKYRHLPILAKPYDQDEFNAAISKMLQGVPKRDVTEAG